MKRHPKYQHIFVTYYGSCIREDGHPIDRKFSGRYWQVYVPGIGWRRIHHLVLETFDRSKREGEVGRHLDGDTDNNHYSNLSWGTQSQNCKDRTAHGTQNPPPVMTEEIRKKIGSKNAVHAANRKRNEKGQFN